MKVSVRQLCIDDWNILRSMRLQALKECEGMYLSSYKQGLERTPEDWQETLTGDDRAIFGLFDGNKPIGLAAVFTWKNDPTQKTGVMAMGYIVSDYRGRGLVRHLYDARIAWAKKHAAIEKLRISHREGNEATKRAAIANGFVYTGQKTIHFGDGTEDADHNYELIL